MATEVAHLQARLTADTRDFDRGINRSEGRWKKFGSVMKKGALAAGAGLVTLGAVGVKNASNLEEQINKTTVVFRGSQKRILDWSKSTAKSFGISQRASLEAAGTFGNMLVPMGLSRREAGKMSTNMVELAADMASFNNASPEDTLEALRSGLAGETEPLRKFGVFLTEARIKAQAMSMGLYDGTGALSAQAKALATNKIIMKDTADAQGDFGKTSGSMANQQRILKAQFEDVSAKLGQKLLPAVVKVLEKLLEFVTWLDEVAGPKMGEVWRSAVKHVQRWRDGLVRIWEAVKLNFNRFRFWMKEKALQLVLGIAEPFSHLPGRMGKWARDLKDKVNPELERVRKKIEELEATARRSANRKYNIRFVTNAAKVKSDIEDMTARARSAASRTYQGGDFGSFGFGATSLVAMGRQLQSMGFAVGEHPAFGGVSGGHVPGSYHYQGRALDINWPGGGSMEMAKLDWLNSRLRRMPGIKELLWRTAGHFDHLHVAMDRGGVVPGPRGAPVPVLAHGGETFIPTHRRGGGGFGTTIINLPAGSYIYDPEGLMRLIQRASGMSGRRGGPSLGI